MEALTLPLAIPEQPNPPPRPRQRGPRIVAEAVEKLMPDIVEWFGEDYEESERESIAEQIRDAIGRSFTLDGFEIAYVLKDRYSWECNTELCECLDGIHSCLHEAHRNRVAEWVAANGIAPAFAVGDAVKTPWGVGPIVKIDAMQGTYLVQTEDFLTRSPDQRGKQSGMVVVFEAAQSTAETMIAKAEPKHIESNA